MPRPAQPQAQPPRVLHFNDCARVGEILVKHARAQALPWNYLPPAAVRPAHNPSPGLAGRARWLPYYLRRLREVRRVDLVHVHYATSVPLIEQGGIPPRPYFLHLHGSDIRRRWTEAEYHAQVQGAIDRARAVFYTNADTREQALSARSDAIYMPAFVDFSELPPRRLAERPVLRFASRWDDDKGVEDQLDLVRALSQAFPQLPLEGLDWGPGAKRAAQLGVRLQPPMPHDAYLEWLAGARIVIGQANRILAVSEFEAMAIGVPVAALGSRLPRPDDGSTPPVIEGGAEQVLAAVREAISSPQASVQLAAELGGAAWVRAHHDPAPYVQQLAELYRDAV